MYEIIEEEILNYLRKHHGKQHIGIVAFDLQRSPAIIFDVSNSLHNRGCLKMHGVHYIEGI